MDINPIIEYRFIYMAQKTNNKINADVQEKVLQFGRSLKRSGIPINKLVIFGSYAKNKATKESDIDVCVVSPNFGKDQIDEMQYLFKARRNIDGRIEPYPVSIDEYRELESPLIWEIKKYGFEISNLL